MLDILRLAAVSLRSGLRGRRALLDTSVLAFRAWPGDLDFNLHLNNARYLTMMDFGRVDVLLAGGLGLWRNGGHQPLVGATFIRYFKPLGPLQRFELRTRLAAYDEKWLYFEQRFVRAGRLHALAAVKGLMVQGGKPVPTRACLEATGRVPPPSPALPGWMAQWLVAERAAIDHLKAEPGGAG